eukprot:263836_1
MESAIADLNTNQTKNTQQLKQMFAAQFDKNCKGMNEQLTKQQKDTIGSIKTSLKSIDKHQDNVDNSMKQLNHTLVQEAKDIKDIMNIARDDINNKTQNILNIARDDINNKLEEELEGILHTSSKQVKTNIVEDMATETNNLNKQQQTIMDMVSTVKTVICPLNSECKILKVIDDNYEKDATTEYSVEKVKVQCNDVMSTMLMKSEWKIKNGMMLTNKDDDVQFLFHMDKRNDDLDAQNENY